MRKMTCGLAGISILLFMCTRPCSVFAARDTQYWKTESFSWGFAEDWKLTLENEMYFQDDCSDFYYQHTDLGVVYSGLAKWLDLGLNYRHVLSESKSNWNREERPHMNATVKWKWLDSAFSNRSRFEYRIKEDADDFWRYRNNTTVRLPWKWTRRQIQPFLSDEFFVDFDKKELNENRLSGGVSLRISEHVSAEVYYTWRRLKSSDVWVTHNIIGTRLKLAF
ncbi:MAG: DUF2490 domain-containing protein [Candidatus Omnitrophota bacterium]